MVSNTQRRSQLICRYAFNAGKLRYASEEEQELWGECSRLLTNAILYYNMVMLSQAVSQKEQQGDTAGVMFLLGVSPIAWTYINFYGRFAFTEDTELVPLAAFVETIAQYRPRRTQCIVHHAGATPKTTAFRWALRFLGAAGTETRRT